MLFSAKVYASSLPNQISYFEWDYTSRSPNSSPTPKNQNIKRPRRKYSNRQRTNMQLLFLYYACSVHTMRGKIESKHAHSREQPAWILLCLFWKQMWDQSLIVLTGSFISSYSLFPRHYWKWISPQNYPCHVKLSLWVEMITAAFFILRLMRCTILDSQHMM